MADKKPFEVMGTVFTSGPDSADELEHMRNTAFENLVERRVNEVVQSLADEHGFSLDDAFKVLRSMADNHACWKTTPKEKTTLKEKTMPKEKVHGRSVKLSKNREVWVGKAGGEFYTRFTNEDKHTWLRLSAEAVEAFNKLTSGAVGAETIHGWVLRTDVGECTDSDDGEIRWEPAPDNHIE